MKLVNRTMSLVVLLLGFVQRLDLCNCAVGSSYVDLLLAQLVGGQAHAGLWSISSGFTFFREVSLLGTIL